MLTNNLFDKFLILLTIFVICNTTLCSFVYAKSVYTEKETAALVQFRKLMKDDLYNDYMKSDPYLIRWIRARNFKLEDAAVMLRNAINWRKANKIDGILNETHILDFQSPPFYLDGIDNEGSTIATLLPARVDTRALILMGKRPEVIRYFDQLMETAEILSLVLQGIIRNDSSLYYSVPKEIKDVSQKVSKADKSNVLMDLHGWSLRQHACLACFGVYVEWFNHMENYYPGYAKRFIMINAPRIAVPLVELVKTVISPETAAVFKVYDSNRAEWLPALRKFAAPDQLRSNFGGTKRD